MNKTVPNLNKISKKQLGQYQYLHGDSGTLLKKFKDGYFKLVVTSPPYNVGKDYETKKSIEEYLSNQTRIIEEIVRVTDESGSICWQVGNFIDTKSKEVFPLDIYYYEIFKRFGLKLRNRIIWHFGHGLHASSRFSGRYETILWFTKSDNYTFNLDNVRVEQKYPGKKHYKGPNKGKYSGNPRGKNPTDIWEIPNVKSNHVEKTIHPCQFPITLVDRLVLSMTGVNDWVLDPFAGVGSTIISSIRNKRNSVGIEKMSNYISIGEKRIEDMKNGILKIREDIPVYDHKLSNLSKIPENFKP
jgi:adenine-specific DNA-methyltransferase